MKTDLEVLAEKAVAFAGKLLNTPVEAPYKVKAEGAFLLTCAYFLAKSKQNLEAVITLCDAGYSQQAMMIARSSYEMSMTLAYIAKDIPGRALRYAEYDHIERHKWLKKAEKHKAGWGKEFLSKNDPNRHEEVRKEYDRVKGDYDVKAYSWAGKGMNFRAICEDVNADRDYDMTYAFMCAFTHNSTLQGSEYCEMDESGTIKIASDPNPTYREPALALASVHTLLVASQFIAAFMLDLKKENEDLLMQFTPKKE